MSLLPALCAKNLSVMNARTNITNRRLLNPTAELGLLAAITVVVLGQLSGSNLAKAPSTSEGNHAAVKINPLKPPPQGSIPVAFLISEGAVMIDFTGPWEVFQDVMVPGRADHPFHLYTVSESTSPIHTSGGMKIVPEYTFENAPAPKVIVIPAQNEPSEATLEWIRKSTKTTDVTMSVCTGAFVLAKTGLLSGKAATTFHGAFVSFANEFPEIHLKRGARFVEEGNLATAGGLSSGIDLALRVVERYFGREIAFLFRCRQENIRRRTGQICEHRHERLVTSEWQVETGYHAVRSELSPLLLDRGENGAAGQLRHGRQSREVAVERLGGREIQLR